MPRLVDDPRPGYFKTRLVKGGPWVGARIFRPCQCTINGPDDHDWRETCDRFPPLYAEINGVEANPFEVWCSPEIAKQEYEYLIGLSQWADHNSPDAPEAKPGLKVDINDTPIPDFGD